VTIKLVGKAVIQDILEKHYHRYDFFVMLLNVLEVEGKLEEAC
jgi:hypothetical protein